MKSLKSVVMLVGLMALAGCQRQTIDRVEWVSMGTVAAVQVRGGETKACVEDVKAAFAAIEGLLNAHDAQAEICRLASRSEAEILASCDPSVRKCYEQAFVLRRQTDGAFNPRWRGAGTLDLGAIAKGYAVDVAAARLSPTNDVLVDLGGNLKAVRGDWTVGVKDGEAFLLREGEACATSARYYRGGHIKDGRTGVDVANDVYSVTVVHPTSAMLADGLSTVLFILGREKGEAFVRKNYPEARVFWL